MKDFIKQNWYKLMIGSSMMMASFGFMMNGISPAYSNSKINNTNVSNAPLGGNGVKFGNYSYFVDGGYVYVNQNYNLELTSSYYDNSSWKSGWLKAKLP